MTKKNHHSTLFIVLFLAALLNQSCGKITPAATNTIPHTVLDTPEITMVSPLASPFQNTSTPVPPGVFVLSFHSPLIMSYDTSVWMLDKAMFLQALSLETCQLVEIGPSGNYPSNIESVHLGNIEYSFSFSETSAPGMIAALYIENQSVAGYDYDAGLPVLMIKASQPEWEKCKTLGERVLSTLRFP